MTRDRNPAPQIPLQLTSVDLVLGTGPHVRCLYPSCDLLLTATQGGRRGHDLCPMHENYEAQGDSLICLKSLLANALTGRHTQDHLMPKFTASTVVSFILIPQAFPGLTVATSSYSVVKICPKRNNYCAICPNLPLFQLHKGALGLVNLLLGRLFIQPQPLLLQGAESPQSPSLFGEERVLSGRRL